MRRTRGKPSQLRYFIFDRHSSFPAIFIIALNWLSSTLLLLSGKVFTAGGVSDSLEVVIYKNSGILDFSSWESWGKSWNI